MHAEATSEPHAFPRRPLTWEDLQEFPDDEYWRYQIVDGSLIVSPVPGTAHQFCVARTWQVLDATRPPGLVAMVAPFDLVPWEQQSYQPDVLVARGDDIGPRRMVKAPVLVVEVLSPSTKIFDLTTKRAVYARMGIPHLWYVDPELPSITSLVLHGDAYFETHAVKGDDELVVQEPFPVRILPSALLEP